MTQVYVLDETSGRGGGGGYKYLVCLFFGIINTL